MNTDKSEQADSKAERRYDDEGITIHPSEEQFASFRKFIAYIERSNLRVYGCIKVVPPKGWFACKDYDMTALGKIIMSPTLQEVVECQKGAYIVNHSDLPKMPVRRLQKISGIPSEKHHLAVKEEFWNTFANRSSLNKRLAPDLAYNLHSDSVAHIYGADIQMSLFDRDTHGFHLGHLDTLLDLISIDIPGVNTPYMYFGTWRSSFVWHTEDVDLYSINYLHAGEPKHWYAIPPSYGEDFEKLMKSVFAGETGHCRQFLRHKRFMLSPHVIRQHGIPVHQVTQRAGEFVITFPYAYHAGFNSGFNIAEATNFASPDWIPMGLRSSPCKCKNYTVRLDMRIFLRNFMPEKLEAYQRSLASRPYTPEEKSALFEGVRPSQLDFSRYSPAGCAVCKVFVNMLNSDRCLPAQASDFRDTIVQKLSPEEISRVLLHQAPKITSNTTIFSFDEGLVHCQGCQLAVHQVCYGTVHQESHTWRCESCCQKEVSGKEQKCCLCGLPGNPIRRTLQNSWAHIHCAVAQDFPTFTIRNGWYDITIPSDRPKHNQEHCTYCDRSTGHLVHCQGFFCKVVFHPSCSISVGCPIFLSSHPHTLVCACFPHSIHREYFRNICVPHSSSDCHTLKDGSVVRIKDILSYYDYLVAVPGTAEVWVISEDHIKLINQSPRTVLPPGLKIQVQRPCSVGCTVEVEILEPVFNPEYTVEMGSSQFRIHHRDLVQEKMPQLVKSMRSSSTR